MAFASHLVRLAGVVAAGVALASCGGGGGGGCPACAMPVSVTTFSVRAVAGSPDSGAVDVYVYAATGSQPAIPIIANLQYPGISAYVALPTGPYTVAIDKAGTTTQLATESLGGTTVGTHLTIALAGQIATTTLQIQNFIEPAETAGTSALVAHQASPAVAAAINPVGVGVYQPIGSATPTTSAVSQAFSLSLATGTAGAPGTSGPATNGTTSAGEYFISAIPSTFPSPLGFAAGSPGAIGTLSSVAASATLGGLATNLSTTGSGYPAPAQSLAQDTSNTVPAGAHLSIFVVDSLQFAPGILIGTFDP